MALPITSTASWLFQDLTRSRPLHGLELPLRRDSHDVELAVVSPEAPLVASRTGDGAVEKTALLKRSCA
jgi:hypothetical protein